MTDPFTKPPYPVPAIRPGLKVCPSCERNLPGTDFVLDINPETGKGRSLCFTCSEQAPEKLEKARNDTEKAKQFRNLIRSIGKVTAPTISDLCRDLVSEFGSIKDFASFYHTEIKAAAERRPGTKTVLDACAAVARIIGGSTAYQSTLPEVAILSDEDLAREMQRGCMELIRSLPAEERRGLLTDAGVIETRVSDERDTG